MAAHIVEALTGLPGLAATLLLAAVLLAREVLEAWGGPPAARWRRPLFTAAVPLALLAAAAFALRMLDMAGALG